MKLGTIGQLAGAVLLTVGLAGCMDVSMDVEILSETNGKATTTMVVGADIYPMIKAGMAESQDGAAAEDAFCAEEGAVLTENADGSATCVVTVEGRFDELTADAGDDGAKFEVVSPGVVRVAFATDDMKSELGTEAQDEETKAMMQSFFEGHNITIRIKGREITESNMTISGDKKSAEIVIPFLDLINGTVDLPSEIYAVVRTN